MHIHTYIHMPADYIHAIKHYQMHTKYKKDQEKLIVALEFHDVSMLSFEHMYYFSIIWYFEPYFVERYFVHTDLYTSF